MHPFHRLHALLEAPWLARQVETHLVFSLLERWAYRSTWYALALITLIPLSTSGYQEEEWWVWVTLAVLFLLASALETRHAVAILFLVTKLLLAFGCGLAFVGSFFGVLAGDVTAAWVMALAVTWAPVPEFLPRVTPHQRWLTLGRLAVTPFLAFQLR